MKPRLLLPVALALSWAAAAQEDEFGFDDPFAPPVVKAEALNNEITTTLSSVSRDNYVFGQYNDYDHDGLILDTSFDLTSEQAHVRWTLAGSRLGSNNRAVDFSFVNAGGAIVTINYNEITTQLNDSGTTPYAGSQVLTLPASWTPAVTTTGFNESDIVHEVRNGLHRRSMDLRMSLPLARHYFASLLVELEDKQGTRIQGGAIYTNAANPQSALLPVPVDQQSTSVSLEAGYEGQRMNVSVDYRVIDFDNRDAEIRWQNPYASGLGDDVDYPGGFGALAPAPDYRFSQISISTVYRVNDKIRFVADGVRGESRQQQALPDYTVLPSLAAANPLPVAAVKDPLANSFLHLAAYTNPLPRIAVNFHYRYRERQNRESRYAWQYVRGDGARQPAARSAVFNRPLHLQTEQYEVTGSWRLRNRSRLSMGYEFEQVWRNFAAVEKAEQDQFSVKYRLPRIARMNNHVEWQYVNRGGSMYEWSRSFFQLLSVELINQIPDDQRWTNHPALRQYHLANQTAKQLRWRSSFPVSERWLLQLVINDERTDFDKTDLGLKEDNVRSIDFNLSFVDSADFSAQAFINYRRISRNQLGRSFSGGINKPANVLVPPLPQGSDPSRNAEVLEKSELQSFGGSLDWTVSERLSLAASYAYQFVESTYDVLTGGARDLGVDTPLSPMASRLHNLQADLTYNWSSRINLNFSYQYHRFTDNDWRFAGVDTDSMDKVLALGQTNPDEAVNMLTISMRYQF